MVSLSPLEKEAILNCEEQGNGKYIYQVMSLVKKGLMSPKPIPKFGGISMYRLNDKGIEMREKIKQEKESNIV